MARRPRDTKRDSAATTAKTDSRRGRRTAPVPTIIRLHQDLEPNENHPLGNIDPAAREEQRRQLFATILARIANGPEITSGEERTMEQTDFTSKEGNDQSDGTRR